MEFHSPGASCSAFVTTSTPTWATFAPAEMAATAPWGMASAVMVPKKSATFAGVPPFSTLGL